MCPKSEHQALHKAVRRVFEADTQDEACQQLATLLAEFASRAPKSCDCLEAAFDDALAVLSLPAA